MPTKMTEYDKRFESKAKGYTKPRCWETHAPMPLEIKGNTYYIHGGSATNSHGGDASIFVGLDNASCLTKRHYPWNDGTQVIFPIVDGSVPKNVKEFSKLVRWLSDCILSEEKVFIGCIGGHGRTGLLLSVLTRKLLGIKDSTTYVREHYCKKAVETTAQINWMHKHFEITKVKPSKPQYDSSAFKYYKGSGVTSVTVDLSEVHPMKNSWNIQGDNV